MRDVLIKRTQPSGWIAAWALDLDLVGAKISQNLTAQEPLLIGKIQNPIAS
jgi:hypothetical protein